MLKLRASPGPNSYSLIHARIGFTRNGANKLKVKLNRLHIIVFKHVLRIWRFGDV